MEDDAYQVIILESFEFCSVLFCFLSQSHFDVAYTHAWYFVVSFHYVHFECYIFLIQQGVLEQG